MSQSPKINAPPEPVAVLWPQSPWPHLPTARSRSKFVEGCHRNRLHLSCISIDHHRGGTLSTNFKFKTVTTSLQLGPAKLLKCVQQAASGNGTVSTRVPVLDDQWLEASLFSEEETRSVAYPALRKAISLLEA